MVVNYMEEYVDKIMQDVLSKNDYFKTLYNCDECYDDIKARALNNMKPFYVTSKKGAVFGEYINLESQNRTDAQREVLLAAEFVKHQTRCGKH